MSSHRLRQRRASLTRFLEEAEEDTPQDSDLGIDNEVFDASPSEHGEIVTVSQGSARGTNGTRRDAQARRRENSLDLLDEQPLEPDRLSPSYGMGINGSAVELSQSNGNGDGSPPASRSSTATFPGGSRTGTPMLDQTLSAAFRDKIRSRIQGAKEKVRSKSKDDSWSQQDSEIRREVESRASGSFRWQKELSALLEGDSTPQGPSAREAYDFFTKASDEQMVHGRVSPVGKKASRDKVPKSKSRAETAVQVDSEDGEDGDDAGEEGDKRLLVQEMFASPYKLELCKRALPTYKPISKRVEDEKSVLYVPSTEPLTKEEKFADYDPGEDGLYVESIPDSFLHNTRSSNKFMQRVYKEQGQSFFARLASWIWRDAALAWSIESQGANDETADDKKQSPADANLLVYEAPKTRAELALLKPAHDAKYLLTVNVTSLVFRAHDLFSDEHVTAREMIDFHKAYRDLSEDLNVSVFSQKIAALQVSIRNLEKQLNNQEKNDVDDENEEEDEPGADLDRQSRLELYREQMCEASEQRREIVKTFRHRLLGLLSSWEDLESLRKRQNFQSTSVKLVYREVRPEEDEDGEHKILAQLIKDSCEAEVQHRAKVNERAKEKYRKELRAWKQWQRSQRRMSRLDGDAVNLSPPELNDTAADVSAGDEQRAKPQPPPNSIDEDELAALIKSDTFLLDGRLPGEPIFTDIELVYGSPISDFKECPRSEQKRRTDLAKRMFSVDLTVGGKSSLKTTKKEVTVNLSVSWNQPARLKLFSKTPVIAGEVHEFRGANKQKILGAVTIPLPDSWVTEVSGPATGSLSFGNDEDETRGFIEYSAFWELDAAGAPMSPLQSNGTPHDSRNLEQIREWREKNIGRLDPHDPDNIALLEMLKKYENAPGRVTGDLADTLSSLAGDESINFCRMSDALENARIKMLMLRAQGVPHLKNVPVPLNEREIPRELLEQNLRASNVSLKTKKGMEAKREKGVKILSRVREQLLKQSQERLDRPRTLEDLVIEEESAGLSFGFNFFAATQHKRPLRPVRKERRKVFGSLVSGSEIKLIITVMHALNVPVRRPCEESNARRASFSTELDISGESKVSPFIEVVFQRQTSRTSTADGAQPTWNETLSLKLKSPNDDYTPSNLTKISDFIYLNLFDEVAALPSSDETVDREGLEPSQTGSNRLERRWLGSLRIPFSTLYLNSKIEGTFRLLTPPVLLGYEYDARSYGNVSRATGNAGNGNGNSLKNTYLTLFLTIDPTLQQPEPLVLKCDSAEDDTLLNHAKKWRADLAADFPTRESKALAIDLTGQWVLVTRYLRPLKPPDELLLNSALTDEVMQRLARFVSLVPCVPDAITLPGVWDIWSTCDQFLDMLMGDEEEHALLLCNFFLFLGRRAGVLLGSGIPEGSTAYVIVWEYAGEEASVWNPTTGERFSVRDSFLPLNSVGCIITPENVYANIQAHEHPNRVSFELTKTSAWRALFSRKFPSPGRLESVQLEVLDYGVIDHGYASELQERIEKHLRECLMRWRKTSRTFFNRNCIQKIRKILPRLEKKVGKLQQTDLMQDLQDVLVVHKMTGFPLNMAYTDMDSITEAVYATGVHLVEDKRVEFASAVYVHPYPCVLSVWVYVASLATLT